MANRLEDLIRQKLGIPAENAAYNAGDALQAKLAALSQLGTPAQPAQASQPHAAPMAPGMMNPGVDMGALMDAQKRQQQALQQQAQQEALAQQMRDQSEAEFDPSQYKNYPTTPKTAKQDDSYADGGTVGGERFSHLKDMQAKHGKATAELDASKNPEKFMEKMKNPSINGLKGVAFSKGGTVKSNKGKK